MPHGRGLLVGGYVLAWLVIFKFGFDVLASRFPSSTPARAAAQSV